MIMIPKGFTLRLTAMKRSAFASALLMLGMASGGSAAKEALPPPDKAATKAPTATPDPATPALETRRMTFSQLYYNQPSLRLRTTEGRATLDFGTRADELVVKASVKLRYTYSPALLPALSHLRIVINGENAGVVPLNKENAGRVVEHEMDLDPRFITGFNQLVVEFVGHYASDCEDPLHSSLWADVSGSSELKLTVHPVALKSDLAMLPQPFVDAHDTRRLNLPYVFAAKPSHATLRAAGITSSWFGKIASWRGARFPAFLDTLPKGHAVVFATNDEKPSFLDVKERFTGPSISILTNPADGYSRLLLVSGRDGNDLRTAASALVLGIDAISGTHIDIRQPREEAPRKAYDAPAWVRLDRPMKFGELIDRPQQLQVLGHVPDPIRLNFRMPPDLFVWRSNGIPVDFKFRYTPPIRASESRLAMSVNDELVQAVNLRASGQSNDLARIALPMLEGGMMGESRDALIPAYKLGTRNQLQYAFSFTYHKEGSCRDTQVENVRAMVDQDSTIDFSGLPHYTEMPNLGYFATLGFPFTKYADLGESTVVMPQAPSAQDIEVMLTLLGRMGEATGYPTTRVAVAGAGDESLLKNRDLLLIGTSENQDLLAKWGEKLPAIISGTQRRISQPVRSVNFLYDWLGFGTEPDTAVGTQQMLHGDGPLAALLGFESPLTSGRSVVAVTAVNSKDLTQALDALEKESNAKAMYGSAVFVRGDKVESILAGSTYTLGVLPFWVSIRYFLSEHPILKLVLSIASLVLLMFACWRLFKFVTGDRKGGQK